MSQLSFASVFDQAKATESGAPQRPAVLPEQTPTPVRRMLTIDEARRQFIRVFKDTARNLRRWDVFRDFITLAASELDLVRIRTPENIERSREICVKYSDSDIKNLHELFCLMVCALGAKFHDFLGAIFMGLEAGFNPSEQMFAHCIDIDPIAADMSFIQLSLLGIPAQVVTGNALTLECSRVRYTPVYCINNFEKRLDDQRRIGAMRKFLQGLNEAA